MCHVSSAVKVASFYHLELEERNEKSDETLGFWVKYPAPWCPQTSLQKFPAFFGMKNGKLFWFVDRAAISMRPFFLMFFLCADKKSMVVSGSLNRW